MTRSSRCVRVQPTVAAAGGGGEISGSAAGDNGVPGLFLPPETPASGSVDATHGWVVWGSGPALGRAEMKMPAVPPAHPGISVLFRVVSRTNRCPHQAWPDLRDPIPARTRHQMTPDARRTPTSPSPHRPKWMSTARARGPFPTSKRPLPTPTASRLRHAGCAATRRLARRRGAAANPQAGASRRGTAKPGGGAHGRWLAMPPDAAAALAEPFQRLLCARIPPRRRRLLLISSSPAAQHLRLGQVVGRFWLAGAKTGDSAPQAQRPDGAVKGRRHLRRAPRGWRR